MRTLLQRICWNTRSWQLPDGVKKKDGGYPGKYGFGHEEWNFQTEDAYSGYVFGYLRYQPSALTLAEAGGHFQIGFWTLHPATRQKLLVGFYHDATLATKSELDELDVHFAKNRIYQRRVEELCVVPNLKPDRARKEVYDSVRKGILRFKCKVKDIELLTLPRVLPAKINGKTVGQYFANPTILDNSLKLDEEVQPTVRGKSLAGRTSPLVEDAYLRESPARLKQIEPRHNRLSNAFARWLKEQGYTDIKQEIHSVDVEFRDGPSLCRAELKTCYGITTTKTIREALGQLLEYNFYGVRERADKWFVVLDQEPHPDDHAWLRKLHDVFGLPIALCWLMGDRFQVKTFGD